MGNIWVAATFPPLKGNLEMRWTLARSIHLWSRPRTRATLMTYTGRGGGKSSRNWVLRALISFPITYPHHCRPSRIGIGSCSRFRFAYPRSNFCTPPPQSFPNLPCVGHGFWRPEQWLRQRPVRRSKRTFAS